MASFSYRLPFPPSINTYWRRVGHRVWPTNRAQYYRRDVIQSMAKESFPLRPLDTRLGVNIEFIMPDKRKRDLDNYLKVLLDAIKHSKVFEDDEQIDELRVKRLHVEAPGCVDVTICELV